MIVLEVLLLICVVVFLGALLVRAYPDNSKRNRK